MSVDPVPMSEREQEARKALVDADAYAARFGETQDGDIDRDHLRAALDECAALRQQLADAQRVEREHDAAVEEAQRQTLARLQLERENRELRQQLADARAALGVVCGAADTLLDIHSLGTLAFADKAIADGTDTLIHAVRAARSLA